MLTLLPAVGNSAVYQPVGDGDSVSASRSIRTAPRYASETGATAISDGQGSQGKTRLFDTVEFGRPLDSLPVWLDMLERNQSSPIFQSEKYFNKTTTWRKLKDQASDKPILEKLRIVNSFWNAWPYHEDQANWGKPDYWATPAQFLKKSGDCEDYAIVKYFTLKELGVDPRSMRIVVLRDAVRNLAHAVLAVYVDNDIYILDNLSNVVLSHKRISNYVPQYSVNEFGRWSHIKPRTKRK